MATPQQVIGKTDSASGNPTFYVTIIKASPNEVKLYKFTENNDDWSLSTHLTIKDSGLERFKNPKPWIRH